MPVNAHLKVFDRTASSAFPTVEMLQMLPGTVKEGKNAWFSIIISTYSTINIIIISQTPSHFNRFS